METHLSGWVRTQHDRDWTLAERMAYYRFRGVSIAVIDDYKIEWAKGYGWADSSEHRPVTTATLFQAASISKSLNSVGVLRLVQDGKLDLNTDVNQYLKGWKFPYDSVSKGKKITMAELLSHTAGLTVHGFPGYDINDTIPSIQQILDGQRPANSPRVRSMIEPGLRSIYSGGGITNTISIRNWPRLVFGRTPPTWLTPYIDSNTALGVVIQQRGNDKYFSHGGANEGFRCQYYGSFHGGKGIVVMVNSDNGAIMDEITNSVATVYKWEGFYKPVVKTEIDVPAPSRQYTGAYVLDKDTVRLLEKSGKIFVDVGFDQWQLHFTSKDDFFLYDDRSDLQFLRENDRVSGIQINHRRTYKKMDQ